MMVLVSVEPEGVSNHLPAFMYHCQVPPPFFEFNAQLPGVTWADMVFPFFLFSMGAAIPFALGRRIRQKTPVYKLVGSALLRGLILSLFAIYVEHIRTGCVDAKYTAGMAGSGLQLFLIGTAGFLILFPVLGRLPSHWSSRSQILVKAGGWAAAIALMFIVRYDPKVSLAHSATFSLDRYDVIIMILANVAVYTTLVYIATRKNQLLRLGFLGFVFAIHFAASATGWVRSLEANFPIPCVQQLVFLGSMGTAILRTVNTFFSLSLLDYTFLSICGSIVGDRILTWMNASEADESKPLSWTSARFAGLGILLPAVTVLSLISLQARYVLGLVVILVPLLALGNWMVRNPSTSIEALIHDVYKWGIYLLALGILFEPYQDGIKKDPATLSYFFVSGGLAVMTLLAFIIIIEVFQKKRVVQLLIDNGQNPMIAYTVGGNLVGTILVVTGIDACLKSTLTSPWPYFCYSAVFTLLVALAVSFCTRRKIFFRT
jgi:predicted acyltransferase